MKPQTSDFEPKPELSGTKAESARDAAAEALILSVLGREPVFPIPDDFAQRVSRHVFAQPKLPQRRWTGWGPKLAIASTGLLMAGMFALAPHVTPSLNNVAFDGELLLLAELSGLLLFARDLLGRE